ncbi:hypothetical protein BE08_20780 [Sorangium cellulosum]|uniref:Cytochrome c domain-containing protein n=1 Tax=Sorangium cellulosum TaxID=56 RepID=A0A150PHI3_SORCE|nr:hypothetical protein BE08_20780 [Sorangium cellulosum]
MGCDAGEASYQPIDGPPVQLVEARATTSLDQNYQPVRTALDPSGATPVLSTASIVLKFDRFLLPRSIGGAALADFVCLSGDLATQVRTPADCVNPVPLAATYNPVQREVILRQVEGMPGLVPGSRYALTVLGPADGDAASGVRAFDGAPLRDNVRLEFVVAQTNPPQATPEFRMPGGDFYCQRDLECVTENCPDDPLCGTCVKGAAYVLVTCVGCHLDGNAAAGLNLNVGPPLFNNAAPLLETAIGHAAHQTQVGEHAHVAEQTPERFGRAMPLIDPYNPGNSYLLYKIIVGESAIDPSLTGEAAEKHRAEVERLRAAFVTGMPMPPPESGPVFRFFPETADDPTLTPYVDGMDILSAWILAGAVPRDCSTPAP